MQSDTCMESYYDIQSQYHIPETTRMSQVHNVGPEFHTVCRIYQDYTNQSLSGVSITTASEVMPS